MTTTWTDDSKTAVLLTKPDDQSTILFRKGDFVAFDGREDGVKIVDIRGNDDALGPGGFEYLPWRAAEHRWATPIFAGFGHQPRFVVCYPSGISAFGQHINWASFQLLNGGKCPDQN